MYAAEGIEILEEDLSDNKRALYSDELIFDTVV